MAQSVLMVYEHIESLNEFDYWKKYIGFYEKYWDGPATPQSSWWGQEYNNFRQSLSDHLGTETQHIKDCFFFKNEGGEYFVCPIGNSINLNILAIDNIIPLEWFILFHADEKKYFFTHTGFGAVHHDSIYYRSNLEKSMDRINKAEKLLINSFKIDEGNLKSYEYIIKLKEVVKGIFNIKDWLSGFSKEGMIILNYGEITNHIVQDSMKNENSVGEIWNILDNLEKRNFKEANSDLRHFNIKWSDISMNAAGLQNDMHTKLQ